MKGNGKCELNARQHFKIEEIGHGGTSCEDEGSLTIVLTIGDFTCHAKPFGGIE
jgi:hypothetical protein